MIVKLYNKKDSESNIVVKASFEKKNIEPKDTYITDNQYYIVTDNKCTFKVKYIIGPKLIYNLKYCSIDGVYVSPGSVFSNLALKLIIRLVIGTDK
ncbi:hypothetical protein PIROE2DRAFT_11855 [Piromyces sp. E2]|nr:hypothetical protein PIROE2DRAFT_11855 [Piromyces sp. E2]|eukprot:OUM61977.1 hypothetical protein PIROE2DRAFT_11855 [Piromyces sp. E2]